MVVEEFFRFFFVCIIEEFFEFRGGFVFFWENLFLFGKLVFI